MYHIFKYNFIDKAVIKIVVFFYSMGANTSRQAYIFILIILRT